MNSSKKQIYPVLGLSLLGLLLLVAYVTNSIFLERLMACSLILLFVFIGKMRDNTNEYDKRTNGKMNSQSS